MNHKLKGNLILLITAMIWGSAFVSQSVGMDHISPNTFNGLRSMLGGLVLLPVIFFLDKGKSKEAAYRWSNQKLLLAGVICGLFLCAASTVQTLGLRYTSVANSGFITTLYIILVPIISVFLKKKVGWITYAAAILALFGLYLISFSNGEIKVNIGDLLTLLCAVLFTFHIMAIDYFSNKVDPVKLSCLQFFVCGFTNIIFMTIFENPEIAAIKSCWLAIAYSGILSCGVGYTLQIVGQKYTDPSSAAIIMSLEAVFGAIAGFVILHEQLTVRNVFGCVIMFAAILLVQVPDLLPKINSNH